MRIVASINVCASIIEVRTTIKFTDLNVRMVYDCSLTTLSLSRACEVRQWTLLCPACYQQVRKSLRNHLL
jgi:hypothetical protein